MSEIEGFYACFMSGTEGNGFAMFVFKDGQIAGSDALGVLFDGNYNSNDGNGYSVSIKVSIPKNGQVIQGVTAGPEGMTYTVDFELPKSFLEDDFVAIQTPLGAINFRLQKIRGFDE